MKVAFGAYVYDFHKDYFSNLAEEIENRNGEIIYAKKDKHYNADFTIQVDEIYPRHGGKGIFINHGLVNFPQNGFFADRKCMVAIQKNTDYIFIPSKDWESWYSMYKKPMYVTGYVRLDKLFNNLEPDGTAVYAPTHKHKTVRCGWNVDIIKKACLDMGYKKFVYREHPAFNENKLTLEETFKRASLFISDYSSVGLESLALRIPTILIGQAKWRRNNHISHGASVNAGQRIYDWKEFVEALERTKDINYNMENRIIWSNKLCEYQGTSASKMVDVMESLL